jgi:hypothetical protein
MKLQGDDYNKKEMTPKNVGLVEPSRKEWSVKVLGQELLRKVCVVVIDRRLTHSKIRSVEVKEKRWTRTLWRMMKE